MDLPDFDYLLELAENNPEELDALRCRYNQQLIDAAPDRLKRRLNGLLFKIDMEKLRSKNPTQCCINISRLMMDSFVDLQSSIVDTAMIKSTETGVSESTLADVICFPGAE